MVRGTIHRTLIWHGVSQGNRNLPPACSPNYTTPEVTLNNNNIEVRTNNGVRAGPWQVCTVSGMTLLVYKSVSGSWTPLVRR